MKVTNAEPRRNNTKSVVKKDALHIRQPSSQNDKESKVSFVQKASNSFKQGIKGFLESTGNILKQVQQDMAQEDFSLSNAFKK